MSGWTRQAMHMACPRYDTRAMALFVHEQPSVFMCMVVDASSDIRFTCRSKASYVGISLFLACPCHTDRSRTQGLGVALRVSLDPKVRDTTSFPPSPSLISLHNPAQPSNWHTTAALFFLSFSPIPLSTSPLPTQLPASRRALHPSTHLTHQPTHPPNSTQPTNPPPTTTPPGRRDGASLRRLGSTPGSFNFGSGVKERPVGHACRVSAQAAPAGEDSDGSARCSVMSGWRSQWPRDSTNTRIGRA